MKRFAIFVLCSALALPLCAQGKTPTDADVSYALGLLMGANVKGTGLAISIDDFVAAFKTALAGGAARMTDAQAQATLQTAYQAVQSKAKTENLAAGRAFLATNAKKTGVKVTSSGLQYETIKMGTGPKPAATDTVTVHYEGRLIGGKIFDSSYARKEPTSFPLNGVIRGWTEGLQLMPVGSKFRFYLPSELAYGEEGAGDDIGPNLVLIFDVELLSIKGK
jgi:FKBP-type peptidyl-prolyl cis-trans isomerase FklB